MTHEITNTTKSLNRKHTFKVTGAVYAMITNNIGLVTRKYNINK